MKIIVLSIFLLGFFLQAEEQLTLLSHFGIGTINRVLIETTIDKDPTKKYVGISDAKELQKIQKALSTTNADGSVWKLIDVTRVDTVVIFHDDSKCSYFEIYNGVFLRSPIGKNGGFGLGPGEEDLRRILAENQEVKTPKIEVSQSATQAVK